MTATMRTPRNETGYECPRCHRQMSPEREEYAVCPACAGYHGYKYVGDGEHATGVCGETWNDGDTYRCLNPKCGEVVADADLKKSEHWGALCDPETGGCGYVVIAPRSLRQEAREERAEEDREQ